jgi:hypothetical protein
MALQPLQFRRVCDLRRATISLFMCVRPSVRMELGFLWRDLHEGWYLTNFFLKSVEKIQVSLKSDKNNRYFTWRPVYIFDHISLISFSGMRNISDKRCIGNQNTHFVCSNIFFPQKNRAVYEIMWKDMVNPDRPLMTIWRMRTACWIPKATNTHSDYVIVIAFAQKWLHECYAIRTMPVLANQATFYGWEAEHVARMSEMTYFLFRQSDGRDDLGGLGEGW